MEDNKAYVKLGDPTGSFFDPTSDTFVGGSAPVKVPLTAEVNRALAVKRLIRLTDEEVKEHLASLAPAEVTAKAPAATEELTEREKELNQHTVEELKAMYKLYEPDGDTSAFKRKADWVAAIIAAEAEETTEDPNAGEPTGDADLNGEGSGSAE